MSWNAAYEAERRAALLPVETDFRRLPQGLREQARLFRVDLLAAAGAADLAGLFCGPHDYPSLYLHFWIIEAWPLTAGAVLPLSERSLTRSGFFTAAARQLAEDIEDPDTLTTAAARPLLDYLVEHAGLPHAAGSPTGTYAAAAWDRFADGSDRFAPHKLPALHAAYLAGHAADLPALDLFLDRLNDLYRTVLRFRTLRRDLQAGRRTGLVDELLTAAGIPADDPGWNARLAGALVVSGLLEGPVQAAREKLAAAREAWVEPGPGGFGSYLNHLAGSLEQAGRIFRPGAADPAFPTAGFMIPAIDTARASLRSAEAFLLSDLSFRESWEVHRYGLFGRDEVVSRFPAGLVLELLCETGHDLPETVDAYITHLAAHDFGYFDDREIILRDADTLGLALRLWEHSSRPDGRVRESLEDALRTLEGAVRTDGRIPVWLEEAPPGVRLAGEGCGVVEAHLLLGLLAFDPVRFEGLIADSAAGLFARFAAHGPGISVNYPALYAYLAIGRLADALDRAGMAGAWSENWQQKFGIKVRRELRQVEFSPQEAALALLLCARPGMEDLRWSGFPTLIRKHQRSDGSWNAEPFCFVANRGNRASWYSSRTVTTALCYRSLKTISKNET